MGGPAVFGGTLAQERVAAYVVAHILAEMPLNWAELGVPDQPVAITGEVSGPGDDLRVEIAGTTFELDVQSKRGLQRKKLLEWAGMVARRLPAAPDLHVILAVDPRSASIVRAAFRTDLLRMRNGRTGRDGAMGEGAGWQQLHQVTRDVRDRMGAVCGGLRAADALLSRMDVVELHLDHNWSESRKTALAILRGILRDPSRAEEAWTAIEVECAELCRDRNRRDRAAWVRFLGGRGIHIVPLGHAATRAPAAVGAPGLAPAVLDTDVTSGTTDAPARALDLRGWQRVVTAARGMSALDRLASRWWAIGTLAAAACTVVGAGLWRIVPAFHTATVTLGVVTGGLGFYALRPLAARAAQLRRSSGVPCPNGCGGVWPALDAAEVFRTAGHLGDLRQGTSAWVPCAIYPDDPRLRVTVAWPLAYAEMIDTLIAHASSARVAASTVRGASSENNQDEEREQAREDARFADAATRFLNDGVAGVADDAILSGYDRYLALWTNQAWPRRDRVALYRLLVALDVRAALEA